MTACERGIYTGDGIGTPVHTDGQENSITEKQTTSSLSFYYNGDVWELEQIDVSPMDQGIGKRLISEFVRAVGEGVPVHGSCIEENTREKLKSLGYYEKVVTEGSLEIKEEAILSQLKIVRVLSGGGVKIEKLFLSPEDPEQGLGPKWQEYPELIQDGHYISVDLYGHT